MAKSRAAHLSLGQLVVREEEAFELDPVQDVQDLGGFWQWTRLQRLHALKSEMN